MEKIYDIEIPEEHTQRTVIDLWDVEKGEYVDADDFLNGQDEANLSQVRHALSRAYTSGIHKFVCAACGQPVMLKQQFFAGKDKASYYFAHYPNSNPCPVKTSREDYDQFTLACDSYQQFLSTELHRHMARRLFETISEDHAFTNVINGNSDTEEMTNGLMVWHRTDVAADFEGKKIAIQCQVYNMFLSGIVFNNSYFQKEKTDIIWLFPYFSPAQRQMYQKDVYYAHHRNVFVFDGEGYYWHEGDKDHRKPMPPKEDGYEYAQEASASYGKLMLNCYWQVPIIVDGTLRIKWNHKLIGFDELTFDKNYDCYYYDSDKDFYDNSSEEKRKLISEWENANKKRVDKIFKHIEERPGKVSTPEEHEKPIRFLRKGNGATKSCLLSSTVSQSLLLSRRMKDGGMRQMELLSLTHSLKRRCPSTVLPHS